MIEFNPFKFNCLFGNLMTGNIIEACRHNLFMMSDNLLLNYVESRQYNYTSL